MDRSKGDLRSLMVRMNINPRKMSAVHTMMGLSSWNTAATSKEPAGAMEET